MTTREKQIYDLISSNPMISQDEIAERLNITRSSVSVYITNMMKKGLIIGRGYILDQSEEEHYPVCIGTVAVDFYGTVDSQQSETNMFDNGDLSMYYGGCGKNIAEHLKVLDYSPRIISAVGNDLLGRELINQCNVNGLDVSNCLTVNNGHTASYLEIKQSESNAIFMGLTNWKINYELTPDFFAGKQRVLSKASAIIIDDSIPQESVEYLHNIYGKERLILQSTARLHMYRSILPLFGLIITDISYLAALFGLDQQREYTAQFAREVGTLLSEYGIDHCLFSFGPSTTCYLYNDRLYYLNVSFLDSLKEEKNYQRFSAARSAIAAVAFYCMDHNYTIESIMRHVAAARHHIAVHGRISSYALTANYLREHLSHMDVNHLIFRINNRSGE